MGTMCISGAALFKAGANVSTNLTETEYDMAIQQAESMINVQTQFNWTDVYATLDVDVKYILELACSSLAGNFLINYDMGGYSGKREAETMLDVNFDAYTKAIKELEDVKRRDFTNNA